MARPIVVYLILLAIILALVFFVLPQERGPTTTSIATTVGKPTTIIQTTSQTTTVNPNLTSCLSNEPTVLIQNGDFSTGTYSGWNVTGIGFGKVPSNITYDNDNLVYFSSPWSGYAGTFFATNFDGGTQVAGGNLTSNTFQVTEPYLNLQLISPQNENLYIAILRNGTPAIITYFNSYKVPGNSANATSTFVNASISLLPVLCDNVQIKVVAGTSLSSTGASNLNYMAVTNFYLSKKPISSPGVIVNQTINLTS